MTFGLWNRKAPRDESKPPAATVSKSKWTSLKAKLSPQRDQQHLDIKPSVNIKDSPRDQPREPRSGAPSSFVPAAPAPAPRSAGWPSRLRVKTGLGLHLRGKLSFKAKTKKPGSSRPPSLESLPEWDPQFYASTMEAERRALAERKHAAVTIRKEEHRRAELFNWPPEAVLRPLPPPMTQHTGDVIDGADTTSARSAVPPGTPDLLDASNSMVDLPKEVGSGHSSDRQTSPRSLQPGSSISSVKGATPRATAGPPNPIPIITVEEATPKSLRTRATKCIYRPPISALEFKAYRYGIAKSQDITVKEEESGSASDRPESPEVFLPPLPPPLPRNPCNVVEDAETTQVHPPVRLRTRATAGPPNPIPIITVEEATPKSLRTRTTKCIYRPPLSALEFKAYRYGIAKSQDIAVKEEESGSASDRPESPEVFLPPLPPPLPRDPCNVVEGAETTSVHSPVRLRTRGSSNVSPRPSIGETEEAQPTGLQTGSSGRIQLPPLPASEPKPGNVSTTSPTPETKQGSPLQHEIVSARSAAKQTDIRLPVGNPNPKEADEGSKDSESEDSDGDDETPRASMIGVPNGFAAAMVRQPTQSGHPPARGINRRDTLKATSTNHPRTERTRQPRPPSRGHQNPELALLHHVPPVSETGIHGRGSTEQSNAPPNRQVGLSAKVMWARQLRYRLDFCDKIGDRRTYAAAAQEALAAGYVICPNHVLRRASAIIPIDMALFPNNPADL